MIFVIGVTGATIIGFVAGLLTIRSASSWCPTCGVSLVCPEHHPAETTVDRSATEST